MKSLKSHEDLRKEILALTKDYYAARFGEEKPFAPGDIIRYSGRVFDESEMTNLVDASLDFWLTAGRFADAFEARFASLLSLPYCSLVNSGSSANLLAFMALTSPELDDRRIKKGDEVITVAAGFPTTVAPIVQYGAVPVFVDVTIPQYNIDVEQMKLALSEKTKAVFIAHTLGNPFDLKEVKDFCASNNLWLIEDNCDALGSEYFYKGERRLTGTIGDISTYSFYPPHHITMGEGGAVCTANPLLKKLVDSYRDWGRDCFCKPGQDNSCHNRFSKQFGELPLGYDHKYVYSHFGYNLKVTDMQASVGLAQLDKLPHFTKRRRENWQKFRERLGVFSDTLILPEKNPDSNPNWFGFLMTVNSSNFSRNDITAHLEANGIQTRNLFAGNILKHPCFDELREQKSGYRVVGQLANTDRIMNDSFWIGVYPGIADTMIDFIVETIGAYIKLKEV